MEKEFFDSVIIGRGLTGLSAAIESNENKNTALFFIEKEKELNANSFNAQGGIASAINSNDSTEKHFKDTIKAGAGLCNKQIVKILVEKGKEKILELIESGFEFDKQNGISFGLESGHSEKRILHSKGDSIGKELTSFYLKLAKEKNIHFFPGKKLNELITKKGTAKAVVFDDLLVEFNSLIFASGGYSSLYSKNTGKGLNKGNALSTALKAGIELMDLEFEQFHPTTIKENNFLLSETLRGEGAFLVNDSGKKFMENISGKDLATRDIVSVKVLEETEKKRKVFLDCSEIKNFKERFPLINLKLKEMKLNSDLIEIEPAAHYSIGGIKIDLNARTNLRNVFAAGECSCSGVHGANRLASNSLLEAVVFGSIAGKNAMQEKKNEKIKLKVNSVNLTENSGFDFSLLQKLMWDYCGIKRNEKGLKKGLTEIKKMQKNNYTFLAEKIIESALNRKETRGTHFRTDFPEMNKAEHSIIKK